MSDDRPIQKTGFASFFASAPTVDQSYLLPPQSPIQESNRPSISFKNALSTSAFESKSTINQHEYKTYTPAKTNGHRSPKRTAKTAEGKSKRNFKCIADPDLDKSIPKGTKPVFRYDGKSDALIETQDPRPHRDYAIKLSRGRRKYRSEVVLPKWSRDVNSLGPEPPHAILITELSPLTTSHEIGMQFRGFGEFAELKLQVDPANGSSLGLCRIVYRKTAKGGTATNAAQSATAKMDGAKVGGAIIKVTLDGTGKLCEEAFKQAVMEREEARALAAFAAKQTIPQVPSARNSPKPTQIPTAPRSAQSRVEERTKADRPVSREDKPYSRSSNSRNDDSKVSSSTSETNKRLGNSAYIFISGKVLPLHKVTPKELQLHFSGKKNRDIFTDSYGFYVTFADDATASHAHRTMDRSTFLGYRLHMELHKSKKVLHQDKPMASAFKKSFQPADPIMETTNRLIKELQEVFMRDLRSRIAGPAILDFLDPAGFTADQKSIVNPVATKQEAVDERKVADVLSVIPRFKKNRRPKEAMRSRVNHRMDHHTLYDSSDASDNDSRDQRSERPSSVVRSIDEGDATPLRKKVLQTRKPTNLVKEERSDSEAEDFLATFKKNAPASDEDEIMADILPDVDVEMKKHDVDFTSSEDEEETKDVKTEDETGIEAEAEDVDMEDSDVESVFESKDVKQVPTIRSELEDEEEIVLNITGMQSIVKDQEDYDLLQEVLQNTKPADVGDVEAWATALKGPAIKAITDKPKAKRKKENHWDRVNKTGSAKTEGHYPIPDIEKSYYLPNRNRAAITVEEVGNSSSRMNRANNRRQAAGFEAQRQTLEAQTDLLRFNSLKSRKKQLKFSRSAIHDWGLYALEHIERGDMVIEYVGEIIRQQVADHREKRYERQGIGSSYLFRIDEDTVIDATKAGNIARFINHSCDPSCTAKIIQIYNQKKIVIYALKDIAVGEEVTYDYKFEKESEDKKIPCLCGSAICRRTLN